MIGALLGGWLGYRDLIIALLMSYSSLAPKMLGQPGIIALAALGSTVTVGIQLLQLPLNSFFRL